MVAQFLEVVKTLKDEDLSQPKISNHFHRVLEKTKQTYHLFFSLRLPVRQRFSFLPRWWVTPGHSPYGIQQSAIGIWYAECINRID